jgi:hypothetical protein
MKYWFLVQCMLKCFVTWPKISAEWRNHLSLQWREHFLISVHAFFFFLHMLGNFENILNTHPSMMGLYCVLSLWWKQAIPWGDRREQFNNTSASYYGLPPLLPHITYARSYNCFLRKLWVYVLRLVVPFHFHLHKHKSVKRVEERHFPKQQYEYVLLMVERKTVIQLFAFLKAAHCLMSTMIT